MSTTQNLIYSAVQAAHNFGAVAVVGGALGGVVVKHPGPRKILAQIALAGWAVQALSGGTFGAVSYYYYGKFPDIGNTAWTALFIKMACVATGFTLLAAYLAWGADWAESKRNGAWHASLALGVTALSAAAVLRWFS